MSVADLARLLFPTLFLAHCACTAATAERLSAPNKHLRDAEGRVVILRGINVINKDGDFTPWHGPEEFARIRSWGMNCVRLGILWAGVEPERGVYDDAYLQRMITLAEQMGAEGIHVVLDFHQDIYSEYFGGDGAPEWATLDGGIPFEPREDWFMNYFEPAVQHAFGAFWQDQEQIQTAYHEMLAYVVERFSGVDSVIGVDLMNEPWPEPLVGAIFDPEFYAEFLRRAHAAVASVDAGFLTFWEPRVTTNWGAPSYLASHPENDWVMAPHYYDPATEAPWGYLGVPVLMTTAMTRRAGERLRFRDPVWVGEYGITWETPGAAEYLRDLQNLFDFYGFGSAYWEYARGDSGFGVEYPDGSERPVVDVLVRPLPRRVAGDPVRFGPAALSGSWQLTWTGGRQIDAPTEIFVPAGRHYPNGFEVRSSDLPGRWDYEWDETTEILRVWHDRSRFSRSITLIAKSEE
jgi:endoglycosylceramidase